MQISERRKQAGLTQSELAQRVGISVSQIWRIERGQSGTTPPVLDAIDRTLAAAESKRAEAAPERSAA